tara:strand:+ start:1873 stop:2817 length:945 start_codon:yes stop_codon:yes gene_type:complete
MLRKNVETLLDKAFGKGVIARDGLNYQLSCPFCAKKSSSSKKKFHVRLDDFRYHCWVCGAKGKNIWALVKRLKPGLEGVPNVKTTKNFFIKEEEEVSIELPPGLVPVFRKSKDPDVKSVQNYLKKRGISTQKMIRWRIMTSTSGQFRRRALIPSFDDDGKLNYYVARSIDENTFRYKNAKVKKTEIIFNEIDVNWSKPIVIVEGVFDAIKCPENVIPLLGSSISKRSKLYKKIVKNQSDVIISLDPDLPEKAYQVAKTISEGGNQVYICFAPEGNDMGDMSEIDAFKLIQDAIPYNGFMNLNHKIGKIRSGSVI